MVERYYPFDAELKFAESLTLTADDIVQLNAADRIIDLGAARYDATLVIVLEAYVSANADNVYTFVLEGSNSATFASGIIPLALRQVGHDTVVLGNGAITGLGRMELPFHNEVLGTIYRYVRLNVLVAGTSKSITFTAFISRSSASSP